MSNPRSILSHALTRVFMAFPACFLGLLMLSGCTNEGQNRRIEPTEAFGMLSNRFAILLDVREKEELDGGLAAGALWMPMSKIKAGGEAWEKFKAESLKKSKTIIVYCAAGGRAAKVTDILNKSGFNTGNMGGFKDWQQAKLPVVKAPTP